MWCLIVMIGLYGLLAVAPLLASTEPEMNTNENTNEVRHHED